MLGVLVVRIMEPVHLKGGDASATNTRDSISAGLDQDTETKILRFRCIPKCFETS